MNNSPIKAKHGLYKLLESNEHFIVVDKAPGICSQGARDGESLVRYLRQDLESEQVYPVHRLDEGTSGIMVFARNTQANQALSQAFENKQVQKFYIALTNKKGKKKQGLICGDMSKSRNGNWILNTTQAKPAKTYFFSFGLDDGRRLVVLKPVTGKTHQIRVAMKAIGSPIIGDTRYGGLEADRLYLHAHSLRFPLFGEAFEFSSFPSEGALFAERDLQELFSSKLPLSGLNWPK